MRYRAVSDDGDMVAVERGGLFQGADAVAAAVRSRLLTLRGEWWESPDEGVPLGLLVGRLDDEKIQLSDALIKQRISMTEGVLEILNYQSEKVNDRRKIYVEVLTVFGEDARAEVMV